MGRGRTLPIYVNHLKSMMEGRAQTAPKRLRQTREIVRILAARFGQALTTAPFVVLGDMNDYLDPPEPSQALQTLVRSASLVNIVERISDPAQRWTHYWAGGGEYRQLDYILLSKGLAEANPGAVPDIIRAGLPYRATRYAGRRFPGVGDNKPKASDHCPVVVELAVP